MYKKLRPEEMSAFNVETEEQKGKGAWEPQNVGAVKARDCGWI